MRLFQKMKVILRDAKLQNKILFCFLTITAIMAIAIGGFSYEYSANIIMQKTKSQSLETIEQLSQNIDYNITMINDKLSYLSYNPAIQDELNRDISGLSQAELNFNKRTISKYMVQSYTSVTMVDMEIYGNNGENFYFTSESHKPTLPHEKEYLAAAAKGAGLNVVINDTSPDGNIQIVKEISDTTTLRPLGVLRAGLQRSVIEGIVNDVNFASKGFIVVLDQNQNLIAGAKDFFGANSAHLFPGWSGSFRIRVNNKEYVVSYMRSQYTRWLTVGVVPRKALQQEVLPLQTGTVLVTLLVSLICLLLARGLTSFILKPIIAVVKALDAFSKGDFSVRLKADRNDETGQLSKGFNQMIVKIDSLIDESYRRELLKKESEFKALQAQIKPHMLYNTLDTINWMARKQGMEEICRMVTAVSDLMRISISNRQSFIPVSDEIKYVKDYLYIQKVRYRERLSSFIDVDDRILPVSIPKLILQPIVENAVVHGAEPIRRPVVITLIGTMENETIVFTIKDTGNGIPPETLLHLLDNRSDAEIQQGHTHLGIYAVDQRIKYVYGRSYGLSVESEYGSGTTVTIRIPYRGSNGGPMLGGTAHE